MGAVRILWFPFMTAALVAAGIVLFREQEHLVDDVPKSNGPPVPLAQFTPCSTLPDSRNTGDLPTALLQSPSAVNAATPLVSDKPDRPHSPSRASARDRGPADLPMECDHDLPEPGHGVGDDPNILFFISRVDVFALDGQATLNQGISYRERGDVSAPPELPGVPDEIPARGAGVGDDRLVLFSTGCVDIFDLEDPTLVAHLFLQVDPSTPLNQGVAYEAPAEPVVAIQKQDDGLNQGITYKETSETLPTSTSVDRP